MFGPCMRVVAQPGHTLGSGAHDHEVRHLDARRLAGLPTVAGELNAARRNCRSKVIRVKKSLCAPARDSTLVRLSP
jgi:hypothetical protein